MPIYAYRCESCGFEQDVLQKMSDAPRTTCPSCKADAFRKQLTAAGFQLKGSGWYVTDFRDKGGSGKKSATVDPAAPASSSTPAASPAPAAPESSGPAASAAPASGGSPPAGDKAA